MAEEFYGLVCQSQDRSTRVEHESVTGKVFVMTNKGASFEIITDGSCPWPPRGIVGRRVKVVVLDESVEPAPDSR